LQEVSRDPNDPDSQACNERAYLVFRYRIQGI
jgi:hypothetical protein